MVIWCYKKNNIDAFSVLLPIQEESKNFHILRFLSSIKNSNIKQILVLEDPILFFDFNEF